MNLILVNIITKIFESIFRHQLYKEELENAVDLVLGRMQIAEEPYKFFKSENSRTIYFFRVDVTKRKRTGQLNRYCQAFLPKDQLDPDLIDARGVAQDLFFTELERIKQSKDFKFTNPERFTREEPVYTGSDIKIFEDKTKWFPWQREIYNLMFDENGNLREAHPRHIYSLIDIDGNSGKSSFFKWVLYKHSDLVGRIAYGTASQLRSSLVNIGNKKIYIIDLARSKSKADKEEDLLSAIEDLKSGLVINPMFGNGKLLLMEPPHIIISSNYLLNYQLLSKDRWQIFQLKQNKTLGKPNALLKKEKKREIIKK